MTGQADVRVRVCVCVWGLCSLTSISTALPEVEHEERKQIPFGLDKNDWTLKDLSLCHAFGAWL